MENDFLEFDEPEEQLPEMIPAMASPVDDIKDGDDIVSKFVGINWFLLVVVFNLSVLHAFSNNWIDFITSLFVPKNTEDTKLKNQIIELKNQLEQISQADEFAKYSKIERKILQLRQMLDAKNKDYSSQKSQTSSAFYKCWRIIASLCALFLMWNYSTSPIVSFPKSHWFDPIDWLIRFPTGIPGSVGIPFFTFVLKTSLSNMKFPKVSNNSRTKTKSNINTTTSSNRSYIDVSLD